MKKTKDVKTTTILKFQSFVYLTAFRKFSKAKHWEINISHLTVRCDCSEKEAEFACSDFKAIVLNSRGSLAETLHVPSREMDEQSMYV